MHLMSFFTACRKGLDNPHLMLVHEIQHSQGWVCLSDNDNLVGKPDLPLSSSQREPAAACIHQKSSVISMQRFTLSAGRQPREEQNTRRRTQHPLTDSQSKDES